MGLMGLTSTGECSLVSIVSLYQLITSTERREYPKNDAEAVNYVELLRDLRQGLDRHAQKKGRSGEQGFELTIAAVSD